jgi:hypothetical protein
MHQEAMYIFKAISVKMLKSMCHICLLFFVIVCRILVDDAFKGASNSTKKFVANERIEDMV